MTETLSPEEERKSHEEHYAPGTFGCHEALQMAFIFSENVANYLMDHPSITANPEWLALADKAHDALFDLYQAIGKEHL